MHSIERDLLDKNKELKGEVEQLKDIVERQAEVIKGLQIQMDRMNHLFILHDKSITQIQDQTGMRPDYFKE